MNAVAMASRFDVLWIGGCVFAVGLMFAGAGLLWDQHRKAKQREEARAFLLKRLDEFCKPDRQTVIEQARKSWALTDGDGIVPIKKGRTK